MLPAIVESEENVRGIGINNSYKAQAAAQGSPAASLDTSSCASSAMFRGDVSRQWPGHIGTGSYFLCGLSCKELVDD